MYIDIQTYTYIGLTRTYTGMHTYRADPDPAQGRSHINHQMHIYTHIFIYEVNPISKMIKYGVPHIYINR